PHRSPRAGLWPSGVLRPPPSAESGTVRRPGAPGGRCEPPWRLGGAMIGSSSTSPRSLGGFVSQRSGAGVLAVPHRTQGRQTVLEGELEGAAVVVKGRRVAAPHRRGPGVLARS